jgi:hypothetical protein
MRAAMQQPPRKKVRCLDAVEAVYRSRFFKTLLIAQYSGSLKAAVLSRAPLLIFSVANTGGVNERANPS